MNYLVSEASLSASADAIRTKTNSNETIEWNGENGFADAIDNISVGIDTSDDTVTPETLIEGTTAHNNNGEPITGTNPYELESTNTTVNTQANLIEQIKTALEGKAGGGSGVEIETCDIIFNDPIEVWYEATIYYTSISETGEIIPCEFEFTGNTTIPSVIRNTIIFVYMFEARDPTTSITITNGEYINSTSFRIFAARCGTENNGNCIITTSIT